MQKPISITAVSSISSIGKNADEVWNNYLKDRSFVSESQFQNTSVYVAAIPDDAKVEIEKLRVSDNKYKSLDDTVLFAMYTSRQAMQQAGWDGSDNFGINIGSSRGATALFEQYHKGFLEKNKTETLSSPTTTLGNIASWVAHDLQTKGPEISHSITCSTALHSFLNGVAWISSGMCNKFLVGGSEAPLTPFTIAQMQALKIYSRRKDEFPCQALNLEKTENTMVLGEGASMICLEEGEKDNALAFVKGYGYATEILKHNISISSDAVCFQRSMKMALGETPFNEVDVVVMHAPGTIKGDMSEVNAIVKVFGENIPALTTNKWKIGHTFGASGALSLELAIQMMHHQKFIDVPFIETKKTPKKIENVLVNAVGFGGNAVSILLSKN
ncbi:beta-ketoacyl synthase N-terminal-like domain-containing protein [Seonamhaeicola marinus]|uniref:Beta-ketoacyl synthase n=1 Tax=Seonamhaeicola marinus TaxID=1912246 RepID=A0A5D0HRG7_9FLAO|nr:beta-ketoacyl synthase N-terminal-like domain-containing protein [Seonamhaeicola marinus]TYA73924.1 beta-ketoacyl synthase [Seonamhaeicola marinus]